MKAIPPLLAAGSALLLLSACAEKPIPATTSPSQIERPKPADEVTSPDAGPDAGDPPASSTGAPPPGDAIPPSDPPPVDPAKPPTPDSATRSA
ncbi:hypothetical protein [Brevundimonas sp.]|uniref:hypothetical protein n=1 Tax=Brevundimonas sp. TaxID=1871086 RepID=UPI003D6D6A8F